MSWTARLRALGIELPTMALPVGSYLPACRLDDTVMTSGQIPIRDGKVTVAGRVGEDVTLEQAVDAARLCTLNALAAVASVAASLDHVQRVIRVVVYVASAPSFTDQPKVANGASDLLVDVFGDVGRHVRSAVGVAVLPLNVPVELELTVQLASCT